MRRTVWSKRPAIPARHIPRIVGLAVAAWAVLLAVILCGVWLVR